MYDPAGLDGVFDAYRRAGVSARLLAGWKDRLARADEHDGQGGYVGFVGHDERSESADAGLEGILDKMLRASDALSKLDDWLDGREPPGMRTARRLPKRCRILTLDGLDAAIAADEEPETLGDARGIEPPEPHSHGR